MKLTSTDKLKAQMRVGRVYRRADLGSLSSAVDRDLQRLEERGSIVKVGPGLYQRPKASNFGPLPPTERELVKSFLKDSRFLLTSFNHFNALGLGLTQLYNATRVYNKKRHGKMKLAGRTFEFLRPVDFPRKLSKEFLLVDLLNNINELAEDQELLKNRVAAKVHQFDRNILLKTATKYGKLKTKKFFEHALATGA